MALATKDWKDSPDTSTPLSAAALEDLESRLTAFTTSQANLWHPLYQEHGRLVGGSATGTYHSNVVSNSALDGADLTAPGYGRLYRSLAQAGATGLTQRWRVRAWITSNATAAGASCVLGPVGLYPVVNGTGAASTVSYDTGTVVASSTTGSQTNPSASTNYVLTTSSSFTGLTDDYYLLGLVLSGASTAANNVIDWHAVLETSWS